MLPVETAAVSACPTEAELRAFDQGYLPDAEIEWVAAHLESGCTPCTSVLNRLENEPDAFAVELRVAGLRPVVNTVPATIGRYRIVAEVGRGGMGIVYRAIDPGTGRTVAVKCLTASSALDPRRVTRFQREVKALALVTHPNIVRLYDYDLEGDLPYLVMEFIEGESLARRLDRQSLPPAEAASLLERVALAVHAVHRAGLLHRDLKPANILLDRGGEPKVSDFGLTCSAEVTDERLTQVGTALGTPQYMPPEQASDGETLTSRSDVYALGAVLYELLTGRPPFVGETTHSVISQVLNAAPVPPNRLNPKVPRDLETVCLKCLHKEPERRYGSAAELADDLGHWREGKPIAARQVGRAERLWRWSRRNPVMASLAGAVALAVLALFAVSWGLTAWALGEKQRADREALAAMESAATARENEVLMKRHLYIAHAGQVQQAWEAGKYKQVRELLDLYASAATDGEDLRGFEWYYWKRRFREDCGVLSGHLRAVTGLSFSPNGRQLASCSSDRTIKIWDVSKRTLLETLTVHDSAVCAVAFAPDGNLLASGDSGGAIRLWDTRARKGAGTLPRHAGGVIALAFSPDGQWLASGGLIGGLQISTVDPGSQTQPCRINLKCEVRSVAFSPDSRRILAACVDETIRIWENGTGRELQRLHVRRGPAWGALFTQDGRRIVSADESGAVEVWDAATGKVLFTLVGSGRRFQRGLALSPDGEQVALPCLNGTTWIQQLPARGPAPPTAGRTIPGHTTTVSAIAFSPDGRILATGGNDRMIRLFEFQPPSPPDTLVQQGDDPRAHDLAWRSDGRRLVAGCRDQVLRVWDIEQERPFQTLTGHADPIWGVAYSPDDQRIASGASDGTVRLWDPTTGKTTHTFRGHTDHVFGVSFRPGGVHLASCSRDQTIRVWNTVTQKCDWALSGHTGGVWSVAYSPDGRQIASGSDDGTVRIWNTDTGKPQHVLREHSAGVHVVTYSPNGRWLATAGVDTAIHIWDPHTGNRLHTLSGHVDDIWGLAFSPDGSRLASGAWDGLVKLWDTQTWQETLSLNGPHPRCHVVKFSPDGHRLAAGYWDGSVRIWDARPPGP